MAHQQPCSHPSSWILFQKEQTRGTPIHPIALLSHLVMDPQSSNNRQVEATHLAWSSHNKNTVQNDTLSL